MTATQTATKTEKAERMLSRKTGASIKEMSSRLGTNERNVRGLITRLKRRGVRVENLERGSGKFRTVAPSARRK